MVFAIAWRLQFRFELHIPARSLENARTDIQQQVYL